MIWTRISEPERRSELLASAVGRAYAAKAAAEEREVPLPESAPGEIWATADDTATAWVMPRDHEVVLADLLTAEREPAAVWALLNSLAADAGWSGSWHFSVYAGQETMAALAESAQGTRVATKMRVDVAAVPASRGIRLRPMDDAEFDAYRTVSQEGYARERFESGAEQTMEEARRVADEQLAELLPSGPRTPGHRLWTVRDEDDRRAGMLWVGFGDEEAFIYDITMDEDRRGQGAGTQTLRAAAAETARAGLDVLALNVFGINESARRLYAREGYRATEVLWSVPIATG